MCNRGCLLRRLLVAPFGAGGAKRRFCVHPAKAVVPPDPPPGRLVFHIGGRQPYRGRIWHRTRTKLVFIFFRRGANFFNFETVCKTWMNLVRARIANNDESTQRFCLVDDLRCTVFGHACTSCAALPYLRENRFRFAKHRSL